MSDQSATLIFIGIIFSVIWISEAIKGNKKKVKPAEARRNKMNNGGSAFPHVSENSEGMCNVEEGMTLRDYFAAKAMQMLIQECGWKWDKLGESAYEMADAMLNAREGEEKSKEGQ